MHIINDIVIVHRIQCSLVTQLSKAFHEVQVDLPVLSELSHTLKMFLQCWRLQDPSCSFPNVAACRAQQSFQPNQQRSPSGLCYGWGKHPSLWLPLRMSWNVTQQISLLALQAFSFKSCNSCKKSWLSSRSSSTACDPSDPAVHWSIIWLAQ